MKTITQLMLIVLSIFGFFVASSWAGQVTIPNDFRAGNPAVADQVDANFNAVKTAVDDNDSRIKTNTTNVNGKQNRVTGTCPAGQSIRTINADGTVVCEQDDIGIGGDSNYFEFGSLNQFSVTVDTIWTELDTGGPHSFTKFDDGTIIEVHVNSRFRGGTFSGGASGIIFQARIDSNKVYDFGNDASILISGGNEFLSIFNVFPNLTSGSHTVSIWARTNSGSSSSVLLDPGGFGGKIIVKETW